MWRKKFHNDFFLVLPSNNLWMRLSMLISPSAMFVAFDTWIQAYFTAFFQHFTDQLSLDRTFSLSIASLEAVSLCSSLSSFPKSWPARLLTHGNFVSRPTSALLLSACTTGLASSTAALTQSTQYYSQTECSSVARWCSSSAKQGSELTWAELSLLVGINILVEFHTRPLFYFKFSSHKLSKIQ